MTIWLWLAVSVVVAFCMVSLLAGGRSVKRKSRQGVFSRVVAETSFRQEGEEERRVGVLVRKGLEGGASMACFASLSSRA